MKVLVDSRKNTFTISTDLYSLSYDNHDPSYVRLSAGTLNQKLCIWSACDAPGRKDVISRIIKTPHIAAVKGGQRITFEAKSILHGKKTYFFECLEDHIEYGAAFTPAAPIDKIHYFAGWGISDLFRPAVRGEGKKKLDPKTLEINEIKSSKAFPILFNPEPNGLDRQWVSSQDYAKISVNNDPHFNGANWFFTPGLLAFAAADQERASWFSMGVAARPGEYNFSDYEFAGGRFLGLSLTCFGQVFPEGFFETPRIVFHFGSSEKSVLKDYVSFLISSRLVKKSAVKKAAWWREPIFCGWGEQCYEGDLHKIFGEKDRPHEWNPYQYATQAFYEYMVDILDRNKIPVRSIVIDDKWQKQRGLPSADRGKWPDLRGFIDRMHKKGKKVLLWWGLFTGEGVPAELCINKAGAKLSEDPTNPAFMKLLQDAIRRMLSDKKDCYNADGFKIDFTANIPSDEEAVRFGKPWGIEMLKQYLAGIYTASKKVKKDSFIITHAANPYFMDVCDAIRLNDICNQYQDSIVPKMEFRAEMASIACPGLLIDTDNWPAPSRKGWMEYMRLQPALGIPSLYYATHIDLTGEAIQPADWKALAAIWKEYLKKIKN